SRELGELRRDKPHAEGGQDHAARPGRLLPRPAVRGPLASMLNVSRRTGSAPGIPRSSPVAALMYEPSFTNIDLTYLPNAQPCFVRSLRFASQRSRAGLPKGSPNSSSMTISVMQNATPNPSDRRVYPALRPKFCHRQIRN